MPSYVRHTYDPASEYLLEFDSETSLASRSRYTLIITQTKTKPLAEACGVKRHGSVGGGVG